MAQLRSPGASQAPRPWERFRQTGMMFSLPYIHDPRYLEGISEFFGFTSEIYLPVHIDFAATARPWMIDLDRRAYHALVMRMLRELRGRGIALNFVMNFPVFETDRAALVKELGSYIKSGGLVGFTVSDFEFGRLLRKKFPKARLGTSTMAHVESVMSAYHWVEGLGVESICVGRNINKRPKVLKAIKRLGVRVKLIPNDQCIPDCPCTPSHYSEAMAYSRHVAVPRPAGGCFPYPHSLRKNKVWLVAQKDVVPATLPRYQGLIDVVKLTGRCQFTLPELRDKVKAYLEMKSPYHPQYRYFEPRGAWDRITRCDRDCLVCDFCAKSIIPRPEGEPEDSLGPAPAAPRLSVRRSSCG